MAKKKKSPYGNNKNTYRIATMKYGALAAARCRENIAKHEREVKVEGFYCGLLTAIKLMANILQADGYWPKTARRKVPQLVAEMFRMLSAMDSEAVTINDINEVTIDTGLEKLDEELAVIVNQIKEIQLSNRSWTKQYMGNN